MKRLTTAEYAVATTLAGVLMDRLHITGKEALSVAKEAVVLTRLECRIESRSPSVERIK